ncbi:MAG: hypothetical protein KDA27_15115 [Candidatus Eisenbacteria bacterium]|uniref:Uncharacterized protein n=1 Tax=Eiseniibacteriota bacterium TaxID=2212470 RepID=A0A956SG99_UNCEI|nr:hypothetical protein [Candidatus Eisenbacteria bacterium]MCB9466585.1 hypothetical protein [Candidatus Eisenbacteria bacterium]
MNRNKTAFSLGLSLLLLSAVAASVVTGMIPHGNHPVVAPVAEEKDPDQNRQPMPYQELPRLGQGDESDLQMWGRWWGAGGLN